MSKNNNLESIKKSSSNLNKILFIFMIILSSIFWAFAFYAPIEYSQGEYLIIKDDTSYLNITHIKLNYNADSASVKIKFEDDMHFILNSNWKQITSPSIPYDPIEIHFQETFLDNNTLEINVTSTGEGFDDRDSHWNLFYEFEIIIDNSYIIDFNSDVFNSRVDIEASETEFSNFNLNSISGSIDVVFHDVYINSPVNVFIKSGYTDFYIYDSNITSDINFEGDSGALCFITSNSVFANINTQTSSGYTVLSGSSNSFKDVTLATSSGSIEFDIDNSNIHNINLTSSSGYIELQSEKIILTGDISISSASGSVDCEFDEILFSFDRRFDIKGGSGYVEFSWEQGIIMDSSALIYIETDSGSIDVEIATLEENLDLNRFILHVSSVTGYTEVDLYEGEF